MPYLNPENPTDPYMQSASGWLSEDLIQGKYDGIVSNG